MSAFSSPAAAAVRFACCGLTLAALLVASLRAPATRAQDLAARAQDAAAAADSSAAAAEQGAPVVSGVSFEGARGSVETETLRLRVRTAPNRRILGVPGLTWWRWLHRFGDALGGRVGRAFKASGEPPARLDSTRLEGDVARLRAFYNQQGYREATVEARVRLHDGGDRAHVTFALDAGPATYLRRVRYEGLDRLDDGERRALVRASVLRHAPTARAFDPPRFTAEGQRFARPDLLAERQRLLTFLRNRGFAAVTRDSVRAVAFDDRASDSIDVTLRIGTGARHRFGDVRFLVRSPTPDTTLASSTVVEVPGPPGAAYQPRLRVRTERGSRVRASLVRRALRFTPGAVYNQEQVLATKRRLEGTGVFTFTSITPQPADTVVAGGTPYLPHRVEMRARPRHRLRAETFVLQRSEQVLDNTANEVGLGVAFSYENANLLGGGEALRVRTSGSIAAADLTLTLFTSAQADVSTSLTLPYLVQPFGGLDRALGLFDARTRLSLSLLTARRDRLNLRIRARSNARLRLELRHTPTLTSFVDLVDVSVSVPDTLAGFGERFLDPLLGGADGEVDVDPVQEAQILEDYTQQQVNSAFRYTLRAATVDPLRRVDGHSYEGSAEIGNVVPFLVDRFLASPGTVENDVPFLGRRVIYRPYVRGTVDLRRYVPLSSATTLATRFFVGANHPIGDPEVVPFDRRFYAGGASSVRGWGLRELGPGASTLEGATGDVNLLGGDLKLETSVELRATFLRDLAGANWQLASFVDAGNVWLGPRNPGGDAGRFRVRTFGRQVGVGSGLGLRLAWEYLIVRFDVAYRLRDPLPNQGGVLADGLGRPTLHFGIGHAF